MKRKDPEKSKYAPKGLKKGKDPLSPNSKSYQEERIRRAAIIASKRIAGQTFKEIAKAEGVTAPAIFYRLQSLSPELREVLKLNHYDLNVAVKKMVDLTDAKKTEYFANQGIVTDKRDVEDNSTRLKAREIMLKVHGVDLGGVKIDASSNTQINVLGEAERQALMNRASKLIEMKPKSAE